MAKILVIDDDGVARDALAVFLMRDGHEVLTAADGGNGVQAFKQNAPDLVILDRDLPVMSGHHVLARLREISAATPVVMLTGYDASDDAERYLAAGATAFLSKKDGLLNALREIDRILGVGRKQSAAPAYQAAPPPQRAAAPAAGEELVLVVDDDPRMADTLVRFLASRGYGTAAAPDGDAAVAAALELKPAVVVLDIGMPGRDGVEVLRELAPRLPRTGFLMLSGNEDENVARACLKIGAFDYLSKPASFEALEAAIKGFLFLNKRP